MTLLCQAKALIRNYPLKFIEKPVQNKINKKKEGVKKEKKMMMKKKEHLQLRPIKTCKGTKSSVCCNILRSNNFIV
jgi:hypothetical protein